MAEKFQRTAQIGESYNVVIIPGRKIDSPTKFSYFFFTVHCSGWCVESMERWSNDGELTTREGERERERERGSRASGYQHDCTI